MREIVLTLLYIVIFLIFIALYYVNFKRNYKRAFGLIGVSYALLGIAILIGEVTLK